MGNELSAAIQAEKSNLKDMKLDEVHQKALKWAEMIDEDRNGYIDYDEFYYFFSESAHIFLTDEEISDMFSQMDPERKGIALQQFARTITCVLVPEGYDD